MTNEKNIVIKNLEAKNKELEQNILNNQKGSISGDSQTQSTKFQTDAASEIPQYNSMKDVINGQSGLIKQAQTPLTVNTVSDKQSI